MKLTEVKAVWVPFEVSPLGTEKKCDDLPRFIDQESIKHYLRTHPKLARRRLQWREHFEKEYIEEYVAGVGTLKVLI